MRAFESKKNKLREIKELIYKYFQSFFEKKYKVAEAYLEQLRSLIIKEKEIMGVINFPQSLIKKLNKQKKSFVVIEIFEFIDEVERNIFKREYDNVKNILNYILENRSYPNNSDFFELDIEPDEQSYYTSLLNEYLTTGEPFFKKEYINNRIKGLLLSKGQTSINKESIEDIEDLPLKQYESIIRDLKKKYKATSDDLIIANLVLKEGTTFLKAITILDKIKVKRIDSEDPTESQMVQLIALRDLSSDKKKFSCSGCASPFPTALIKLLKENGKAICPKCGIKLKLTLV